MTLPYRSFHQYDIYLLLFAGCGVRYTSALHFQWQLIILPGERDGEDGSKWRASYQRLWLSPVNTHIESCDDQPSVNTDICVYYTRMQHIMCLPWMLHHTKGGAGGHCSYETYFWTWLDKFILLLQHLLYESVIYVFPMGLFFSLFVFLNMHSCYVSLCFPFYI